MHLKVLVDPFKCKIYGFFKEWLSENIQNLFWYLIFGPFPEK